MISEFRTKRLADLIWLPQRTGVIFLFSHMRAHTSLIGHILGSSSEIMSYYEQQISYSSWKSEYLLKLRYLRKHARKPHGKYYFDKILHNNYTVQPEFLLKKNIKYLFMLRKPEATLSSIVKLFASTNSGHECAGADGAVEYYISRLRFLESLATSLTSNYFYLDAEALTADTDLTLQRIKEYLRLERPLESEYQTDVMTGVSGAGDLSDHLRSGKVKPTRGSIDVSLFTEAQIESCSMAYIKCQNVLITNSQDFCRREGEQEF